MNYRKALKPETHNGSTKKIAQTAEKKYTILHQIELDQNNIALRRNPVYFYPTFCRPHSDDWYGILLPGEVISGSLSCNSIWLPSLLVPAHKSLKKKYSDTLGIILPVVAVLKFFSNSFRTLGG